MTDTHYSIGQAAEYLNISIDTLRRWEAVGKIHAERPNGKDRIFIKSDLDAIKNEQPLSITDAATILEISPSTLRRLADSNILPSTRLENNYRVFKPTDIETFKKSDYYQKNTQSLKQEKSQSSDQAVISPIISVPQ